MTTMSQVHPVVVVTPSFESLASPVMNELGQSLSELVAHLPGTIRRAVDLERALQLERKLAWKVFRLSRSSNLGEVENVPSRAAMALVLEAARRLRVPKAVAGRVHEALEQFEDFATAHCGDRAGLVSMVNGVTREKSEPFELRIRKSLFRAQAHVWGMQVRMQVRTAIYHPRAASPGAYDLLVVSGDLDLQRRRENEPLVVVRFLGSHSDQGASARTGVAGTPGEPVQQALNLMPAFSSDPLPRMATRAREDATEETELCVPTGRTGAVTLYSSQILEGEIVDPSFPFDMFVTAPVETVVRDVMIPVGHSDPATARINVYGRRAHPEKTRVHPTDLLPQREMVAYLGVLECVPPIDGAPRHGEAVRQALQAAGWSGTRFDVYRCRVEYPVLHTMLAVRVDRSRT